MSALGILAAGCTFPAGPVIGLAEPAMHSQLRLTRRHPYVVDRAGAPVRLSMFPVPHAGTVRWVELCAGAMWDLSCQIPASARPALRSGVTALWLVLPEASRPGVPPGLETALIEAIHPSHWAAVRVIRGGHAAAALAIAEAAEAVRRDDAPTVVLGVDTHHDADALAWLEAKERLHGAPIGPPGRDRPNPYGRIPGEGAAALMLGPAAKHASWSLLAGLATADEPMTVDHVGPCTGAGLTAAARAALAQAPALPIAHVIHDLNGEPYRADEYGFTALRLSAHLAPNHERHLPVLASGDLGCASLLTHTAIAAWRCHRDRPAGAHLLLASADDTLRAAVVLHPANTTTRTP